MVCQFVTVSAVQTQRCQDWPDTWIVSCVVAVAVSELVWQIPSPEPRRVDFRKGSRARCRAGGTQVVLASGARNRFLKVSLHLNVPIWNWVKMQRCGKAWEAKLVVTRFGARHQHLLKLKGSHRLCQACVQRAIQTLGLPLHDKPDRSTIAATTDQIQSFDASCLGEVATNDESCSEWWMFRIFRYIAAKDAWLPQTSSGSGCWYDRCAEA